MIYIIITTIIAIAVVSIVKMALQHEKFTMETKERMRLQSPQAQPKNIKLPFFQMEFERNGQQDDKTLSRAELQEMIRETMLEVSKPLEERISAIENHLPTSSVKAISDELPDMADELDKRIGRQRTT
ncbi:MAG TPA: hypothetical protein PLL64_05480 [Rhodothermales bacterium]|nr:hypothetical protein [Rhodothermales bacterium]HRR07402.1 hypothetical protein [Rhodothermales bacterium]